MMTNKIDNLTKLNQSTTPKGHWAIWGVACGFIVSRFFKDSYPEFYVCFLFIIVLALCVILIKGKKQSWFTGWFTAFMCLTAFSLLFAGFSKAITLNMFSVLKNYGNELSNLASVSW